MKLVLQLGFLGIVVISAAFLSCRKDNTPPLSSVAGHNLLLITMDTIRADRIGCYGYTKAQTPALDAIAARGAVFDDALTQVPLTLPSHCTMMTGLHPREFGIRVNNQGALGATHPTLASILKEKGYKTAAFVSAFVLDSRFGLDRSFDIYDDQLSNVSIATEPLHWERPANIATDRALTWLDGNRNGPFFCWIHYFDPHGPYNPPAPFAQSYDGEIAFMDSQIKRIDDWLDRAAIRDKTLLVVLGDHGESFGEHGEEGHGIFLYETSMRVPLIMAHPALVPRPIRVTQTVGVVDAFPTILELMALPPPPGLLSQSFAASLTGNASAAREVYAESEYVWHSHGWSQQRSLTNAAWRFISSATPELYDRKADPGEKNNLFERQPEIGRELSNKLFQQYEQMVPAAPQQVAPSAAATAALATLGYTGGSPKSGDEFLSKNADDPKSRIGVIKDYKEARELLEHGKSEQAVVILRKIAAEAASSPSLVGALGVALVAAKHYNEAVNVLDGALRLDPTHQPALFASGEAYFQLGQLDKAEQFFTAATENDPQDPTSRYMLGKTLKSLKRNEDARKQFQKAVDLVPEFPAAHQELAILLGEAKDIDGAIAHFRAALRGDRNNAQGWVSLGRAQVAVGRHADASEAFAEAVSLEPRDGQSWINLGISLLQSGKPKEGKQALEKAALIPESAGSAYYNLAITAARDKDARSAEHYLKKVIEVAPTHPTAAWDLSRDYLKANRVRDAVTVLREAYTDNPGNVRVLNLLASILATSTDDSIRNGLDAMEIAKAAEQLTQSRNPFVLKTLAEAQAETGDFAAATATANQALQLSPADKYPELHAELNAALTEYRSQRPFRRERFAPPNQ